MGCVESHDAVTPRRTKNRHFNQSDLTEEDEGDDDYFDDDESTENSFDDISSDVSFPPPNMRVTPPANVSFTPFAPMVGDVQQSPPADTDDAWSQSTESKSRPSSVASTFLDPWGEDERRRSSTSLASFSELCPDSLPNPLHANDSKSPAGADDSKSSICSSDSSDGRRKSSTWWPTWVSPNAPKPVAGQSVSKETNSALLQRYELMDQFNPWSPPEQSRCSTE